MQDQRTRSVADEDGSFDKAVLGLMIATSSERPWSKDELDKESGKDTIDSLARLHGVGLIHRLAEGFYWPTRAALRAEELSI